jgi:putative flippase GtrA
VPHGPRLGAAALTHVKQASAFLVIGLLAFLVDAATFNLLVYGGGRGPLFSQPLTAKVIAITLASAVAYIGNKWWTFRARHMRTSARRLLLFFGVNLVAVLLQLGCLAFSRYVLGLADPVADNVSATVVGQALATAFRYVAYEQWVFTPGRGTAPGGTQTGPA